MRPNLNTCNATCCEYDNSFAVRKFLWPSLLPAVLSPVLLCIATDVSANNPNISNIWYRDYLDFGQNKGMFAPGATGLVLDLKDGGKLALPDIPFPDFDIISNSGPVTSIGGAYMITAAHNKFQYKPGQAFWQEETFNPSWGISTYHANNDNDYSTTHVDFAALRLDKFVVETPGIKRGVDFSLSVDKLNERYGVMYGGKKQVLVFRAGSGQLDITTPGNRKKFSTVGYRPELRSGSIFTMHNWNFASHRSTALIFNGFSNSLTQGDSGSISLVWDNELREWVALGVLNGAVYNNLGGEFFTYDKWNEAKIKELKDRFTHNVVLNNGNLLFSTTRDDEYELAGAQKSFQKRQDLSFTGGGFITLRRNLDMGTGGLIFDENKNYTVDGSEFNFRGAGVDIGRGTTVNWKIKGNPSDNLHKIGEGKLIVEQAQGNNLKVGNGDVELVAQQSFNQIYMASGLATVKLRHADALNANNNMNGIYFTKRGGTLDVNGHNQTFKRIAASDSGAIITNTANTRADINLDLPKWKYAYHGQFTRGLNVNLKYDDEVDSQKKFEERHLILDGGMSVHGDVNVKNARITMQGLPARHAVIDSSKCSWSCDKSYESYINNYEKAANDKFGTHYKNSRDPNSFQQPDWDTRTYQFGTLKLENAEIGVGRNSRILGNIDAVKSHVTFGGGTAVFRDHFQGENITASGNGFDFRQQLHQGSSQADDTIYYEGRIKGSGSSFTSTMQKFSASFDLKDGSTFKSLNKSSVTRIMDEGIKVSGKSELVLGDIFVTGNSNRNLINVSTDSKMSVQNVLVSEGMLYVPDHIAEGALNAFNNGSIYVHHWTLDSNLVSDESGKLYIDNLKTAGTQKADANIIVNNELLMADLDPARSGSRASEWVGLDVRKLTLEPTAHIKADFSNDYLSLTNVSFDQENILVRATELNDDRMNKDIAFTAGGKDVDVSSRVDGNQILFSFKDLNPDNSLPETGDGNGNGNGEGGAGSGQAPVELPPALQQFLDTNTNPRAEEILRSIITHNEKSPNKYQEVAIKDAISNHDAAAGAQALSAIVERTDKMTNAVARTLKKSNIVAPVRSSIDSRLASLRRTARAAAATYTPVAASGDAASAMAMSRKTDEEILNNSMFVDISTGLQKDGSRKEHVVSSNLGFDRVLQVENGRMVLGGAFNVTRIDNKNVDARDEGMMYGLTGYMSWEQKRGFELQSYLTGGYLMTDRSMVPEVSLGEQTFDERSVMLMSSNYFKYHLQKGSWNIKPMILMDLGFNHTGSSESDYIKRDSMNQVTLDLGLGVELEGSHESWGYLMQATARNNVWNSDDTVGVNLSSASGYISYEIPGEHETSFNLNGSVSKRLAANLTVDLGVGANATTDGAHGFNANARIRWHF